MNPIAKWMMVAAGCLAATTGLAQDLDPSPYLRGIDGLPAATFKENLASSIRVHRDADATRVSRAVADAFSKVGYAGVGACTAKTLDGVRLDTKSDAGDVLNAIDLISGKRAGGQSEAAKRFYARTNAYGRAYAIGPDRTGLLQDNPRPWQVSPLIRRDPRLGADYSAGSPAYPSGHTTDGYAQSLLLAMVFPERAQQIFARASDYGESRIVLGVHYPLDVIGGRILATAAITQLLTERSTAFGVMRPRRFASAAAIVRAQAARQCCDANDDCGRASIAPYPDRAKDGAAYRARLTYGMTPVAAADRPPVVPPGAEILLATRFPYLDARQRREVLATTEIASGYALDDGSGLARLDLFAANGGYGAFRGNVHVRMNVADGPIAASDVFSNDIHGPGGLTKLGDGALSLTGKNDFTGGITIRGGSIVADATALGRGRIRNDGTLVLKAPGHAQIDNPITGNGQIVKTGPGTLELTMIAGFSGVIVVVEGNVVLRCSSACSARRWAAP